MIMGRTDTEEYQRWEDGYERGELSERRRIVDAIRKLKRPHGRISYIKAMTIVFNKEGEEHEKP
jgi:hypothetical protein